MRVEPRLSSLAATGERTVFLAERRFSLREARRLAAHEVFGHLVVAANARAQPLRLLQIGLAGSFADQEGLALYLEEGSGLMCRERLRTLAARVVATDCCTAAPRSARPRAALHGEHGFSAERRSDRRAHLPRRRRGARRGLPGGLPARARGARALARPALDELRRGRVALGTLPALRELEQRGLGARRALPAELCP